LWSNPWSSSLTTSTSISGKFLTHLVFFEFCCKFDFATNFCAWKKKNICELDAFAYTSIFLKHKMKVMWRLSIAYDIFRTNMVDTIMEMWRCARQSFWSLNSLHLWTQILNMFNTLMKYTKTLFGNNHAQQLHVHWTHCIAKCALDHGRQLKKDWGLFSASNGFQR